MKKIICLLLALLMIFSLAACGDNGNTDDSKPEGTKNERPNNDTTNGTQNPPATSEPAQNGKVLQIPYNEIYLTAPDGWDVANCDDSFVVCQTSDCLVSISYQWHVEFEGQLDDVMDLLLPRFVADAALYSKGRVDVANLEVRSTENGTIAGYDSIRFTAKIRNRDEWDCHVYGYAVVVNNIPLMITGLVSAKAQDADMIAEIDALTDRIAASIEVKK